MKLADLHSQLMEDLGQDIGNDDMHGLSQLAAKAPKLLVKYQILSGNLKLNIKKKQRFLAKRIEEKERVLKGKLSPAELKETFPREFPGLDPHELLNTARTKAETEKLINSLPDIQALVDELDELEECLVASDGAQKQLSSFSYGVKNRIDLFKINNGLN